MIKFLFLLILIIQLTLDSSEKIENSSGPYLTNTKLKIVFSFSEELHSMKYFKELKEHMRTNISQFWEQLLVVKHSKINLHENNCGFITHCDETKNVFCECSCVQTIAGCTKTSSEVYLTNCSNTNQKITPIKDPYEGSNLLVAVEYGSSCSKSCPSVSEPCERDQRTKRPIFGILKLCHSAQNLTVEELSPIINHGLIHILGFQEESYKYFTDQNGEPWNIGTVKDSQGKNCPEFIQQIKSIYNDEETPMITTPNLIQSVVKNYDCSSVKGIPLAKDMSHYLSNVFRSEIMDESNISPHYISQYTIALLIDSGWYQVQYSQFNNLFVPTQKGCEILKTTSFKFT